jgi:two-component system sensor histidine kinase KdpD
MAVMAAPLRPARSACDEIYAFFTPLHGVFVTDRDAGRACVARHRQAVTSLPLDSAPLLRHASTMTLAHAHSIAPAPGTAEGGGLAAGLLAMVALVGLATLLGLTLLARGDLADIGLLYLVPVMFAAIRLGLRPGLAAGALSSLSYNYFFIPPRFTLAVADPSHLITLVILLGVALVGSQMAARLRQQAMLAQAQAGRDALLAGFAGRLMGVTRRDALWAMLAQEVARLFGVRVLVVVPDAQGVVELVTARPAQDRLDLLEAAAAQWCLDSGRSAGPGGQVPTASEWLFMPVPGTQGPLAVVGVGNPDADLPLHGAQAPLLESLLAQAGLALARITWKKKSSRWAGCRSANGCAARCSRRSGTICARRSPPCSARCARCGR